MKSLSDAIDSYPDAPHHHSRRLRTGSAALAGILALLGTVVLVGWSTGSHILTSLHPSFTAMKPNTALSFLLCGIGILALTRPHVSRLPHAVGTLLATGALLTLSQDTFGWDFRIDEILFADEPDARLTGAPGRMSPMTATGLFLFGSALVAYRFAPSSAQILALLPSLIGYFNLGSYLLGLVPVTRLESFTAMAAHTSAGMLLLGPAFWLAQSDHGYAATLSGAGLAGRLARWLLPTAILIPLISAAATSLGAQLNWYSQEFGEAVIVLLSGLLFVALSWLLVRAVGSFQSERSGLHLSLGKADVELKRKRRELEQFAFTVSHDLKSPLVSVRGFLGLMIQNLEAGQLEAALEDARDVDDAAAHMSALIDDMLLYSRIGRSEDAAESIDMEEMLQEIVHLHHARAEEAGVAVKIHPGAPPCEGWPTSMRRAIENLLVNALKYGSTADRPAIELGGRREDRERRYFVRDNGPGIDPQYHERIFGLFQRLDTNQKEGTGVGLASVAKVAEQHGGRAWVESSPGNGATFWISVPDPE